MSNIPYIKMHHSSQSNTNQIHNKNACKLAKIPFINIPSGLTTSKVESITKVEQEKLIKEFEKIDLLLAPNLFARYGWPLRNLLCCRLQ